MWERVAREANIICSCLVACCLLGFAARADYFFIETTYLQVPEDSVEDGA